LVYFVTTAYLVQIIIGLDYPGTFDVPLEIEVIIACKKK